MPRLVSLSTFAALVVILFAKNVAGDCGPPYTVRFDQFKKFYPQYSHKLVEIIQNNCTAVLHNYRANLPPCNSVPVVSCILDQVETGILANMNAAAVLLGLLPTILSLAGSTTVESGLLSLRRPILSFMLVAGAPAVNPIRTFEYVRPSELLARHEDLVKMPAFRPHTQSAILVLEYLLAAAAIANLAEVSYTFGVQTVPSCASTTTFLPAIWAFTALVIHIAGAWALSLRVLIKGRRFGEELRLCAYQSEAKLEVKRETFGFIFLSWCVSMGIIFHLLYGTVIFSSTLFITVQDALGVVFRYLASTIICRLILMFELSGMRKQGSGMPKISTSHH